MPGLVQDDATDDPGSMRRIHGTSLRAGPEKALRLGKLIEEEHGRGWSHLDPPALDRLDVRRARFETSSFARAAGARRASRQSRRWIQHRLRGRKPRASRPRASDGAPGWRRLGARRCRRGSRTPRRRYAQDSARWRQSLAPSRLRRTRGLDRDWKPRHHASPAQTCRPPNAPRDDNILR